ncbi:MAG: HDIG domain-containing protein [Armatimonadetes bacterium]|nr:HDIG domain-containing protein [Armatimonadota bacterium]
MKGSSPERTGVRAMTRHFWVRRAAIGAGTLLLLVAIISVDYRSPRPDLVAGQPSPRDVEAPRTIEFVDVARTEALRNEAMRAVPPAHRHSPALAAAARQMVARTFEAIIAAHLNSKPGSERVAAIRQAARVPLSDVAIRAAAQASRPALEAAARVAQSAVDQALAGGVREDNIRMALERARGVVRSASLAAGLQALAGEVAVAAVRPTMEIDPVRTAELRLHAASLVAPVIVKKQRGEMILRRGDVVTPEHLKILAVAGVYPPRPTWSAIGGVALVVSLLVFVTAAYLWQYQPEIWADDRLLVVWSLTIVITIALVQVLGEPRFNAYLMPAAAGAMLMAILLRPRLALFSSAVLAVLVGLASGRELAPAVVAFVGGVVAVFATRQIHRRSDFGVAGLLVGASNAAVVVGMGLVNGLALSDTTLNAAYGAAAGILSGFITIAVLPFLEQLFGLVTPIKLLELANPAHPLLRRLQLEAPGTYHHSIMVGNLAEAAAEAIGADALLVRVGTYYHDVGKLRRPAFFVENQLGIENPHDRMTPSLSALTVAAHVRDGLELARQYGLPKAIADFIPQHHGTARLTYFYHQALERGDAFDEGAFRYEGPKPQTRETAIVMLADAAEAAVRSLTRPTPDRLDEVVRRIIREKLEDGQLDECGLTFRDLDRIATAFVRILTGVLHPRLEYPDLEGELSRRRRDRVARVR